MIWLMLVLSAVFGYISLSMYLAAFKESDGIERNKLMRSGFGTLVLTLMGLFFAYGSYSSPPAP